MSHRLELVAPREECAGNASRTRPPGPSCAPQSPDKLNARLLIIAGVCALAPMMADLDTTVLTVAQRTFVNEFSSTPANVAWTMTGYLLALMALIPLTGWAADRFGTKRLFLGAVQLFALGSLMCAVAPDITLLVAFRVVQGLGGGIFMPLVFTILAREAGPKRLGRLMAILAAPMMIGPVCGPILGGWLIDAFGWRSIFLINLPISIAAVALAAVTFPRDEPSPTESFDFIGMALLAPGLAALLYSVSSIPSHASLTDPHVYLPAFVGFVFLGAFVFHATSPTTDRPLLDMRLFSNRAVLLSNLSLVLIVSTFFGVELLLPSYFQQVLNQTPLASALHLIPLFAGGMVAMPIAGHVTDKRGPRTVVLAGIVLFTTGMSVFAYSVSQHCPYAPMLLAGLVIMGTGMGCASMPVFGATVMKTLKPDEIARGSTLINVNQRMAASIGAALASVVLTSQLNRSAGIATAAEHVSAGLSHAYAVVFVAAACVVAFASITAVLLPRESAQATESGDARPAATHSQISGGGLADPKPERVEPGVRDSRGTSYGHQRNSAWIKDTLIAG